MGPKHEVNWLWKFSFLKKNLPNFKLEKKNFLNFFQMIYNWKNSTNLNFGKIFNCFAKVQEATKIYKNGIVLQYPPFSLKTSKNTFLTKFDKIGHFRPNYWLLLFFHFFHFFSSFSTNVDCGFTDMGMAVATPKTCNFERLSPL